MAPETRDIVVIGGSAGSVEPIRSVVKSLPANFPAAVFVVVHTGAQPGRLPELLRHAGMKANYAVHGEEVRPGRVYIAPPDNHLTLDRNAVRVFRGPRENGSRPAIDPLFRSAAHSYRQRVVGVVVSGMLDCGAQGMRVIKAVGGVTIVQDPEEADFPDMPRAVKKPDFTLPAAEIPSRLALLASEPIKVSSAIRLPTRSRKIAADLSCPECRGPLSEVSEAGHAEFTCHVGHAFSLAALADEQGKDMETALWSALRSLRESARVNRRLAPNYQGDFSLRLQEKGDALEHHAKLIESFLLSREQNETRFQNGNHPYSRPPGSTPARGRSRTHGRLRTRRRLPVRASRLSPH